MGVTEAPVREAPLIGRLGVAVAAAAAVAFAVFILLLGFGDEWRSGRDGGAHALSVSAVGYAGVAELLAASREGPAVRVVRDRYGLVNAPLLVLTPAHFDDTAALAAVIERREGGPTLIVLDKWQVTMDPLRRGWVRSLGPVNGKDADDEPGEGIEVEVEEMPVDGPEAEPEEPADAEDEPELADMLETGSRLRDAARGGEALTWEGRGMTIPAPAKIQTLTNEFIEPLLVARGGGIVMGKLRDVPVWILADPDLINNRALKTLAGAEAAVALFDQLPAGGAAQFDVTLNGYERSPNLVKLAFEPPFLPATLCILAAALLALGHAAVRFGPAAHAGERVHAFGKRALIDSSAELVQQAGREGHFAGRYAGVIRDLAAERGAAPDADFEILAASAAQAASPPAVLAAAQALHRWKEDQA